MCMKKVGAKSRYFHIFPICQNYFRIEGNLTFGQLAETAESIELPDCGGAVV